ncbi:hypothetical protein SLEP1_g44013 [Rubroshorea leprosula]|uniref:Uncharacterized protein n=1 Tax=Rubroshorea leprosula TaxID=152421 RepID=A0AAV5LFS1_9ROSI|nr:hypothetical protein SLEP1_g44013 [Rubroshorea leprosula]
MWLIVATIGNASCLVSVEVLHFFLVGFGFYRQPTICCLIM